MNPLSHIDPDDPYPDSDGQPMADNTEQYQWLVKIKEHLEILFADSPPDPRRRAPAVEPPAAALQPADFEPLINAELQPNGVQPWDY
jgi:hypothetical protein